MATLLDLKNRTLSYLRRMPGDASIPASSLEDAINRSRRDVWRRVGGPLPDTLTLDIVAGRRDYPVTGPVSSVSYKASATSNAARLTRTSPSGILRRWADLSASEVTSGTPEYWLMRPVGDPSAVEAILYETLVGAPVLASGQLSVSLYPTPSASVTGGLIVECAGPATELSGDSAVSELPESVDAAACWRAATELLAFISHEPEAMQMAAFLKSQSREADSRAFEDVMGLLGDFTGIGPEAYIGVDYTGRTLKGGETVVTRAMEDVSYTVTATAETLNIPCSPTPAADGTVVAISKEQGLITSAVINGAFVTVTADGGLTFYAGDVIKVLYEAQA